jgi:predicted acylesterase/phospholipase RssA
MRTISESKHSRQQAQAITNEAEENYALVIKGGGLKGLACVGALRELQRFYKFDLYVGTSAGAIIAALLGAGYTADEMELILRKMNFTDFLSERGTTVTNLIFHKGLFRGIELTNWVDRLLAEKLNSPTRVKFGQLPHKVRIYACQRDKDALIFDSGQSPEMSVAYAVRCSVAIPLFFTPGTDQGLHVLDGGMRHNYPVKKLLEQTPIKKFLGLYLGDPIYTPRKPSIFRDLINISTEATDVEALEKYRTETVVIDAKPISTLDFALSPEEKTFLLSQGRAAALELLLAKGHIGKEEVVSAVERAKQHKIAALAARNKRSSRTKLVLSFLAVAFASFLLWIVYGSFSTLTSEPDPAIDTILGDCSGRAVFTLMNAEQDPAAMFSSLAKCRDSVQKHRHEIKGKDLQQDATQLIGVIDNIERLGRDNRADRDNAINLQKLTAVSYFRQLAAATGRTYTIPDEGKLVLEFHYLRPEEADAPLSKGDLRNQHAISSTMGRVRP